MRAARGMAEELCHLPDELLPKGLHAHASWWHQLLLSRLPMIGLAMRERWLMAKAWRERRPRPAQPAHISTAPPACRTAEKGDLGPGRGA